MKFSSTSVFIHSFCYVRKGKDYLYGRLPHKGLAWRKNPRKLTLPSPSCFPPLLLERGLLFSPSHAKAKVGRAPPPEVKAREVSASAASAGRSLSSLFLALQSLLLLPEAPLAKGPHVSARGARRSRGSAGGPTCLA